MVRIVVGWRGCMHMHGGQLSVLFIATASLLKKAACLRARLARTMYLASKSVLLLLDRGMRALCKSHCVLCIRWPVCSGLCTRFFEEACMHIYM